MPQSSFRTAPDTEARVAPPPLLCAQGDEGTHSIVQSLRRPVTPDDTRPVLGELNLRNNNLRPQGAAAVAQALRCARALAACRVPRAACRVPAAGGSEMPYACVPRVCVRGCLRV